MKKFKLHVTDVTGRTALSEWIEAPDMTVTRIENTLAEGVPDTLEIDTGGLTLYYNTEHVVSVAMKVVDA